MTRCLLGGALLVATVLCARASADPLPPSVTVDKVTDAEPHFRAIEDALRGLGFPAANVRNLTVPLQTSVGDALKRSPQVVIYPRATFDLCVEELRAGTAKEALRRRLVVEQEGGGLLGRTAAAGKNAARGCRNVRFDLLERVSTPDPHLTPQFARAHLKDKLLTGVYKLLIRSDGKIESAQVVRSIDGADQDVIEQLKRTWQFKPQTEAVCTVRDISFQITE